LTITIELLRSVVAWVATLVASILPDIVARSVAPRPPLAWLGAGRVVLLASLTGLAMATGGLRPISGYVLALAASAVGDFALTFIQGTDRWRSWAAAASESEQLTAQALLHLIPALCMVLTVVGRLDWEQLFMTRPLVDAQARLPLLPPVSWSALAPLLTLLIAGPLLPDALSVMRGAAIRQIFNVLPRALAFGLVNAAQEEFRFRAVLLARALPSLGSGQGLAMTAVFFGLGHYFGHPSGPSGAVLAGVAGWLLGETMLGTGSFLPPWLMHVALDILIFATVAVRSND
jgi:membrane protease YdiL (CAAX protease family)